MIKNGVYDACLLVAVNGDVSTRDSDSELDRRLAAIEEATGGSITIRYNRKLLTDYEPLLKVPNDYVAAFLTVLSDKGVRAERSTLSRTDYARSQDVGWPTHDQHLLAAALGCDKCGIHTTEVKLGTVHKKLKKAFGVAVVHL